MRIMHARHRRHEALVGIEDNKPEAIAAMRRPRAPFAEVKVRPVPARYPMGSDKQLIQTLTGKEVPADGRAADVGVLVHNVGTAAAVHQAMRLGRAAGRAHRHRQRRRAGAARATSWCRSAPWSRTCSPSAGLKAEPARLVMGGPMMGTPLPHARGAARQGRQRHPGLRRAPRPPCPKPAPASAAAAARAPARWACCRWRWRARIRAGDLDGAVDFGLKRLHRLRLLRLRLPVAHPAGAVLQPRQGRTLRRGSAQAAQRSDQAPGRSAHRTPRTRSEGKGRSRRAAQGRARRAKGAAGAPPTLRSAAAATATSRGDAHEHRARHPRVAARPCAQPACRASWPR